jgi:hypothetical protein
MSDAPPVRATSSPPARSHPPRVPRALRGREMSLREPWHLPRTEARERVCVARVFGVRCVVFAREEESVKQLPFVVRN